MPDQCIIYLTAAVPASIMSKFNEHKKKHTFPILIRIGRGTTAILLDCQ